MKPGTNEERIPIPSEASLGRKYSPQEAACILSPSRLSDDAVASPEKKFGGTKHFRFSDYSVQGGIAEIIEYDEEEYNTNVSVSDNNSIPNTTLNSAPSWPSMTMDSDLQSIEVSHFDFMSNAQHDEDKSDDMAIGKKKGYFSLEAKKRMSIRNLLPKWKKSKGKRGVVEI
jgi:hypothetical protein